MASVNRGLLGAAITAHLLAWWLGVGAVALDPDPMNLAYGMDRFDITHFNPHPPGYLVYVWTLRAVHALTGAGDALVDRFATVQLVSLLFALAAVATVYATAKRMKLPDGAAGWAALVISLHPIMVFHSVDAQTHTSEAFASALLLWGAVRYREAPGWQRALALGLILAFGSALRPSFIVFGVPVIVWTIGLRHFADLSVAGVSSILGAIGWVMPTVVASGGWDAWRAATRGLVHHGFVLTSSPFSDSAVDSLVWANQISLGLWTFEAVLPVLVALAVSYASRTPKDPPLGADPGSRWLKGTLFFGGGLAIAYYAVTFVSEPGYLAALLPPVALVVGTLSGGTKGARPAAMAIFATLACWAIPLLPHVLKVPSVAEWKKRTDLGLAYADHIERALPADGRYLVLIGHPDITVGRQLPMLEPRVDVLLIHDGRRPWFAQTALTYVTEVDSVPIPEAFGAPDARSSRKTTNAYAGVYFDGTLPPHFQTQMAEQSNCPVRRARDVTETVIVPTPCLARGSVAFDGLELRLMEVAGDEEGGGR